MNQAIATYLPVLILLVTYYAWKRNTSRSLPPGPRSLPLIGNMLDMKGKELWLRAYEWAKRYGQWFFFFSNMLLIDTTITGDISHLNILGQDIVFINSAQAAFDLLDKRGAIYSEKPRLVMVGEL
jgi:hypothetical protein